MGILEILQQRRALGNDIGGGAMSMPLAGNMNPRNPFLDYLGANKGKITNAFAGMVGAGNDPRQALMGWSKGLQHGQSVDEENAILQQQEAEKKAQLDQTVKQQNLTVQALQRAGRQDLVDAVQAGGMTLPDAWQALTAPAPGPIKASAGDVLLDPKTYQPLATVPDPKGDLAADKEGFDRESALWKEYMAAEPVKTYQALRNSYERIRQSAAADSGPGDLGLIFNYMKMLDPGSVVREGEFATAENAGGVGQQISNIYNKIVNGERLTPELRQQFLKAAESLYSEASSNLETINRSMDTRAKGWGVDGSRIITAPESYGSTSAAPAPGSTLTYNPATGELE